MRPLRDDVLGGVETARGELRGGRFERIDLIGGEAVAARLVPVRAVDRVIGEAHALALGDPVGARRAHLALHHDAPAPCA